MAVSGAARDLHAAALVIDAHVHPSLKTFLWRKKLGKTHRSGGAFNPFTMRVDLPKTIAGGVDVLVSSIYLPEKALLDDCAPLRVLSKVSPKRIRRLFNGDPFERTVEILDDFERALERANRHGRELVRVARSADEIRRAETDGVVAVVHAVEGAHSLGGAVDNVEALWQRGVCMLTLAHFYANEVAAPVMGIPPEMQKLRCFKQPKDLDLGLGPLGPPVIEEMLRLGMIVDLTHCTPRARREAYRICGTRRPLVFSHVGVQPLADDPMSPTEDEIRTIASTGGVIAVIFMNSWLGEHESKNGLDAIVSTIRRITEVGGIDTVAIGSDFDGFTDPPDDLADISQMPKLTQALLDAGIAGAEIEKILGGNMIRVLREGWR
jgi:membrane dipeptidase